MPVKRYDKPTIGFIPDDQLDPKLVLVEYNLIIEPVGLVVFEFRKHCRF